MKCVSCYVNKHPFEFTKSRKVCQECEYQNHRKPSKFMIYVKNIFKKKEKKEKHNYDKVSTENRDYEENITKITS